MGTHDRMPDVTPRGKKSIRMSDEEWARLMWVAERRETTVGDVLREAGDREYQVEMRKFKAEQRRSK